MWGLRVRIKKSELSHVGATLLNVRVVERCIHGMWTESTLGNEWKWTLTTVGFDNMSQSEILNWGPLILFCWSAMHPTGLMVCVVACENRPVLLKMAKAGIYLGFAVGIVLFGIVLEAAINIIPKVLSDTMGKGSVFVFSTLFICYPTPSLAAGMLFKAMFPKKWETYVRLMSRKR